MAPSWNPCCVTGAAQELQSEEQVIQWEGVKTMIWGWCIGAPGPVQAEAGGEAGVSVM